MAFSVFLPSAEEFPGRVPVLTYLAGLTCTPEHFSTKAGAYRLASQLGMALIAPDTSPRGEGVPNLEAWDVGQGAGFYLDAVQGEWAKNFRMYSYIVDELYSLVAEEFPVDNNRHGIFGHSMGGHGALTIFLKNPEKYRSVSAFAPICAPSLCPWGQKSFELYLGSNKESWANYDATALVRSGGDRSGRPQILIDQGLSDVFLAEQLYPELFEEACREKNQSLVLRRHEGYDHGYFFIQSFIEDHLRHHHQLL